MSAQILEPLYVLRGHQNSRRFGLVLPHAERARLKYLEYPRWIGINSMDEKCFVA